MADSDKKTSTALVPIRNTAIQPYKTPPVPAIVGPLGDLQAFLRAAENAPILTPEEEKKLAISLRDNGDLQAA